MDIGPQKKELAFKGANLSNPLLKTSSKSYMNMTTKHMKISGSSLMAPIEEKQNDGQQSTNDERQ